MAAVASVHTRTFGDRCGEGLRGSFTGPRVFRRERSHPLAEAPLPAYISEATKQQLERYAEAHGVKKGHVLEEALLHHLQALRELPADIVIPPRLVLTSESFQKVSNLVKKPRKPSKALRNMMAGKPVDGDF